MATTTIAPAMVRVAGAGAADRAAPAGAFWKRTGEPKDLPVPSGSFSQPERSA